MKAQKGECAAQGHEEVVRWGYEPTARPQHRLDKVGRGSSLILALGTGREGWSGVELCLPPSATKRSHGLLLALLSLTTEEAHPRKACWREWGA